MPTTTLPTPATTTTTTTVRTPASSPGCCAELKTTITQDREDGGIDILEASSRVELADSPRGLGRRLPGRLTDSERALVGDELAAYASRYTPGAVVLERIFDRGNGLLVHVEARLIPLSDREQRDLMELLDDSDTELAQETACEYATELNDAWVAAPDRPPVSVCFLEDIGRSTATTPVLDETINTDEEGRASVCHVARSKQRIGIDAAPGELIPHGELTTNPSLGAGQPARCTA